MPQEGKGMVADLRCATPLWKWHFYYIQRVLLKQLWQALYTSYLEILHNINNSRYADKHEILLERYIFRIVRLIPTLVYLEGSFFITKEIMLQDDSNVHKG